MKNLIYLVLLSVTLISCSEEKQVKRIECPEPQLLRSAIVLFECVSFMKNSEESIDGILFERQELLMDSIIKLDPDFCNGIKHYDNFANRDSRRARDNLRLIAYVNRDEVKLILNLDLIAGDLRTEQSMVDLKLAEDHSHRLFIRRVSGLLSNYDYYLRRL